MFAKIILHTKHRTHTSGRSCTLTHTRHTHARTERSLSFCQWTNTYGKNSCKKRSSEKRRNPYFGCSANNDRRPIETKPAYANWPPSVTGPCWALKVGILHGRRVDGLPGRWFCTYNPLLVELTDKQMLVLSERNVF